MGLDMYLRDSKEKEKGYWRKANQIHTWFVHNIQGGKDDCEPYKVTGEQLLALKDLCLHVIETKDVMKLPTQSGFFFGSTEYGDGYYEDLEETVRILNGVDRNKTYYYQSSW